MYQALSIACFVVIAWFLVWEHGDDRSKSSKKTEASLFPAILGGVVLAPLLALGGLLFALWKIATTVPALLYGVFVLLRGFFEWVQDRLRAVAMRLAEILRDVVHTLRRFLLSRTAGKRIQEFFAVWRDAVQTVLSYLRRLYIALERLTERVVYGLRSFVRSVLRQARMSWRRLTRPYDRTGRPLRSPRPAIQTGLLVPLVRIVRALDGRSRGGDVQADRDTQKKRWTFSLLALFALFAAKRRNTQSEHTQEQELRRSSAGERMHGRRFSAKQTDRTSAFYHARLERGQVAFRRVSSSTSRPTDILQNLRSVGWRVRSRLDRL
ncbi:MAG: hypothetical protein PHS73_04870 [Candidatus Peribacteraceae bacterium]|nr:hypothetical protein [Candidatus Peribacteraceae bacterium]